ncbi:MAG: GC-type dockerin domain-anchored protein, partial [Phycisphaerales bacterium JB064]
VDIQFGFSWAIGEQWAFVGAHQDGSVDRFGGSVYVYRRGPDDRLEFFQKIDTPEPGSSDRFGIGLDFDGRTLAAGAWWATSPIELQGAVYTYELDGDTWTLRQKILHGEPEEEDAFGLNLMVSGDHLVAQAAGRARPGSRESVFHFTRGADGLWRQERELVPTPPEWMQKYGNTMATDGRYAVIGASADQDGAAYLFDLACGACAVDLDADGALTVFDFLAFLNLFQDGDAQADFDGDGALTIFDFLAFQTAFDAGCE